MRHWNIQTHENGNLVVNLVSTDPPHVVNLVVDPTLSAESLYSALQHLEDAAVQHARETVPGHRIRGTLTGSLSVHAADGTDITQPPQENA